MILSGPTGALVDAKFDYVEGDTYQILGLEADLIDPHSDIHLTVDHTSIKYGPVRFTSPGLNMWLPETAELYTDFKGRRIHHHESFSNYLLFGVDDQQKDSAPKTTP
jgi:hypothetical protein